jgi:hypothetical protein
LAAAAKGNHFCFTSGEFFMSTDEKQGKVSPYRFLARQVGSALDNKWVVWVLAFVAFIWPIIASSILFPFYTNNPDEAVYIYQGQALSQGKLFLSVDPHLGDFFRAFDVIHRGNRAIFKVPPVHAAFLALGLRLFGSMRVVLGLVAAGNVFLLYRLILALYSQRRIAVIAAIFFLFSPFFLIQSATFLAYNSALLLHLCFAVLLLRGYFRQSSLLLFLAGLVLGLTFFARPGDAIFVAIPMGVLFIGLHMSEKSSFHNLLKQSGWVLAGFGPMFGLALAYNNFFTGSPFISLYWLWDPQDTPGFGLRAQSTILYNWTAAIKGLTSNLLQLILWVFGGAILPGLVLFQLIIHRIRYRELALLLLMVIFPLAYLFFWGNYHFMLLGVNKNLGPMYYYPVLVSLVILAAQGVLSLSKQKPVLVQLVVISMLMVNAGLLLWHIAQNYAYTRENQAIYRPFVEQQLDNALVFVPPLASGSFLLAPFSYLINTPTLDGPIVYALNLDYKNFVLLDAYPERTPYRFDYYGPYTKTPHDNPETALVKLKRRQVGSFTQHLQITNPAHSPYVFVEILNKGQAETYLLDDSSVQGKQYEIEWTIGPDKIEFQGDHRQHLASIITLSPTDKLVISVAFADDIERQTQQVYERRYTFRFMDDSRLDILLPAETWYNAFWPVTGWLMGNIDEVMTDK